MLQSFTEDQRKEIERIAADAIAATVAGDVRKVTLAIAGDPEIGLMGLADRMKQVERRTIYVISALIPAAILGDLLSPIVKGWLP